MSRVGKMPIAIPDKTAIDLKGSHITVTGPKGKLERDLPQDMTAAVDGQHIIITRPSDQKRHRSLHGLTRALVFNMVEGVSNGYTRALKIIGVGYRAELEGNTLIMYLGYSHPIAFVPPDGITITVQPKENIVTVEGIDKELVGQCAATIRGFRKPEPYKGKGVRYVGEYVRTKAGKTAG
jgi:large subunit ribosomal protein L6